ncbi:serine hydrolase domain-containing protein [Cryptosporangium phraense]|uniref:Beta-lactamase family protein n=1 Tax=Cryptosporangium phraense TaxID=2593070 RepID=A0A545ARR4_9ACTN|nr:serine hydrolase domain-containing protein [Cryptosporangium phraense]TQS43997.1 beta-lactamase family protein [Cryptosporangium phraense]
MTFLSERITAFCDATGVPGYVAGVSRDGDVETAAHGVANLRTGAPMRTDTGFLFGSVTKIMTTALVLRQVERGALDLDAPVVRYLPEFRLTAPGAAETIRVRHLLAHSSGIDADLFFPDATGPGALAAYVDALGRRCGTLFAPGELVSYSNGGMIVAGRLLEVVTGRPYPDLLARDVFAPAGMTTAVTSAKDAILRSTAIGHFPDPETGAPRPTDFFMLPDTWGPAGGTPIGTVADLLAFGRSLPRLLSAESIARMRTVTGDLGTPNSSPVGLGWTIQQHAGTTVLAMTGASPGGVALLAVAPEHDLVFAAYGNDPRALTLHDDLLPALLGGSRERLALAEQSTDLTRYAGTYRSDQLRVDVRMVDGGLEETVTYEPADASQERIFTGFAGGSFSFPPQRYVPVGRDLFAPAGRPLTDVPGYLLISYHGDGPTHRCAGGRLTRRVG